MPNDLTPPDPERFGLAGFADLLSPRDHIVGEDIGTFDGFHAGMVHSLTPLTPHECVVAENLIAIEWELLQHRRMRDAGLRQTIGQEVRTAVLSAERAAYDQALEVAWEAHVEADGDEDTWDPLEFDKDAAWDKADAFAEICRRVDTTGMMEVCEEIRELGMDPLDLMGEAYRNSKPLVTHHEEKLQELERRRREVKRDYDALQGARPIEAEVIEG